MKIKKSLMALMLSISVFVTGICTVQASDTEDMVIVSSDETDMGESFLDSAVVSQIGTVTTKVKDIPAVIPGPSMVKIAIPDLKDGATVKITVCDSSKNVITGPKKIGTKKAARFFIRKKGTYYMRMQASSGSYKVLHYNTVQKSEGGKSAKTAATLLKKQNVKIDFFGNEEKSNINHYYKFTVPTEQETKLYFKKFGSIAPYDSFRVRVYYKSISDANMISQGYIFEGQGAGYMYINNSSDHTKAKAGNYYVIVTKHITSSGFSYSVRLQ